MNEETKQAVSYLKRVNQEWAKAIATSAIRGFSYERLTNNFKIVETALNDCEKEKIELIAEQLRLFDLAKKQENELNDLREFAKLYIAEMVDVDCAKDCNTYDEYVSCYGRELKEAQFNLVKKMVAKYGK